ncbi:MAG: hypothetical protein M3071_00465 [Actinomycetota bacterium]|nr:hypothetical protein [Actinomycetota bacterium]
MSRFRSLYGAGPRHLLVLLLCFAIAGFAVVGWFERPGDVVTVLEWFAAAIVLHDLVVVPLYSLLDRIVFGWLRRPRNAAGSGARGKRRTVLGAVNSTPYLRIPAILSGLLLVVFFPVIFGFGSQAELSASGIRESGYLARWLIASVVIFALSGVAWGAEVRRSRATSDAGPEAGPVAAGDGGELRPAPGPQPESVQIARSGNALRAPAGGAPAVDQAAAGDGDPSALDDVAPGGDATPGRPDETAPGDDAAPAPPDKAAPNDDSAPPPTSD